MVRHVPQSLPGAADGNGTDRPQLIFFTELEGPALLDMLRRPEVLELLSAQQYQVALTITRMDDWRVQATQLLNQRAIPVVAWLLLPPEEGLAFNLQNYPQAVAHYHDFRAWAQSHMLRFEAVGLDIEPPPDEDERDDLWSVRAITRRLWLASENVLYAPARTAYIELIAAIRHDGYEVHTYQVPFVADDRRAGTTLVQRALDIVDVPSDLDVLICSSSVSSEWLNYDLGGALVASYGPAADAIGIGSAGEADDDDEIAPLPWPAVRRDLLLAAQHTDTIYIFALEDCVERGLLGLIAALNWTTPVRAVYSKRTLVATLRGLLFGLLIVGRFGSTTLAWAGWVLAVALWLRGRRAARRRALERKV